MVSQVNRGIIRDDGALDEIVNRLLHLSENLYNAPGGDGDMPDMDVRDEDGEDLGAGDTAKASAGYFWTHRLRTVYVYVKRPRK